MRNYITFRYLYLPWLSGLLVMSVMLLTQSDIFQPAPPIVPITETIEAPKIRDEAPKTVITTAPFFPGCQHLEGKDKRKCSGERMYDYIYNQAGYPAGNPSQRTAGVVVMEFLIAPDGLVRDPKLLRAPGHGRGQDALRIINNMMAEGIRWEPATSSGKPISTRMAITIQYNMVWAGAKPQY